MLAGEALGLFAAVSDEVSFAPVGLGEQLIGLLQRLLIRESDNRSPG